MTRAPANNLDYLATRLHARRSRLAESARLDELCRARSVSELGRLVLPDVESPLSSEFQRRLVQNLVREISDCLLHLDEETQDLMIWELTRFQLENVKILLRGFLNHRTLETLQPHLIHLPPGLRLNFPALLASKSLDDFIARLPENRPRTRLHSMLARGQEPPSIFILEAALDGGYFQELLARIRRLPVGEAEVVKPLGLQEANLFKFLLVVRGKFHFGLAADVLLPLQPVGVNGNDAWFNDLLAAPDVPAAARCGVGRVIDSLPVPGSADRAASGIDISTIEALAWQRYLRLANNAFRCSHLGAGAVAGYFGMRRIEVANLITLSECVRAGMAERESRAWMIPRGEREAAYV